MLELIIGALKEANSFIANTIFLPVDATLLILVLVPVGTVIIFASISILAASTRSRKKVKDCKFNESNKPCGSNKEQRELARERKKEFAVRNLAGLNATKGCPKSKSSLKSSPKRLISKSLVKTKRLWTSSSTKRLILTKRKQTNSLSLILNNNSGSNTASLSFGTGIATVILLADQ